ATSVTRADGRNSSPCGIGSFAPNARGACCRHWKQSCQASAGIRPGEGLCWPLNQSGFRLRLRDQPRGARGSRGKENEGLPLPFFIPVVPVSPVVSQPLPYTDLKSDLS